MKRLLVVLALIVIAMPLAARKRQGEAAMTCMSFNIRFITPKDQGERAWTVRRDAIVAMFNDVKPDVVGIQEQSKESVDWLVANLPDYESYIPDYEDGITLPKGFSMVIFWRKDSYKLKKCGRYFLSDTPYEVSKGWDSNHYRTTSWVHLSDIVTGRTFYCFNTHLDHRGSLAKENGVLKNVEMMRKIAGSRSPVILMGDMNIVRGGEQGALLDPYYGYMQSSGETAVLTEQTKTFNGYDEDISTHRLLDYIFYRNAQAERYDVVDGADYGVRFISDHYPIITLFRL